MARTDGARALPASCRFRTRRRRRWRFTDLRGFDPDGSPRPTVARHRRTGAQQTMLDLDVAGDRRRHRGRDRDRARARRRPLRAADRRRRAALLARRLGREVHRAQRGDVAERPARPRAEGRRAREAALRADRQLGRGRLALLAAARRRRGGRARSRSSRSTRPASPSSPATRTPRSSSSSSRARSSSTSRCRTTRRRPGTSPRTTHASARDAELDWVAGGFGSKKGKIRIQNDLSGPGATSRVTGAYFADGDQHLDYDTFQEHIAPNTESDFAFKGALRDDATRRLARDDPRRAGRAEDERLPGEPQPAALPTRRTPTRFPGSRSWPTTSVARTARRSARSIATSSST